MARRSKPFPWVGASAVAVAVVAGAALFIDLRGPAELGESIYPHGDGARVGLSDLAAEAAAAGREPAAELSLNDPTPLFLPTPLNSGRVDPAMTAERSPGTSFGEFESKLVFPEENNRLAVPDVVQVQGKALDVLEQLAPDISLRELARTDAGPRELAARAALLEVRRVDDGRVVLSREIARGALPGPVLVPLEMMVVVNEFGLMTERGGLDVAAGGGTLPLLGQEQVDLEEVGKLLKSARLGAQLGRGIYRISLGP